MNDSAPALVMERALAGVPPYARHFEGLQVGEEARPDLRSRGGLERAAPGAISTCDAPPDALNGATGGGPASPVDRLAMALGGRTGGYESQIVVASGRERLATAPPLRRASMAPLSWRQVPPARRGSDDAVSGATGVGTAGVADQKAPRDWYSAGTLRRVLLLGLVLSQTYLATSFMVEVLPYHGRQPLELAMLILFAILFGWVSGGFWTAMAGFALIVIGRDRYTISRTAARDATLDPAVRTAIVMPICNENVARVFAGLRATYESLARTGLSAQFDIFVLSDTSDPDTRVAEIDAWFATCSALGAFGHVFYRWRQHRIKRKSGNVADFCRRWGSNYRYMVILDADSVMSGACLAMLVRLMEANPSAGIIQSAPCAAGRDTLHARVQQFAARVYGPLFTAGLHFWQLGESHYWGHNAIIRVAPFMRHCALRRLPGRGIFSGEILSHDFVEAALMRRAGWAVWIAYDLPGSYEETPPNLIDELKRDRRWCLGNLMNFRLLLMRGLHAAHRAVFMSGVMAYVAGPLWFAFLLLSTLLLAVHTLSQPKYFLQPYQLFPLWPEWHPEWALALLAATASLLFLPKVLGVLAAGAREPQRYGGGARLLCSMLGEFVVSALLAPIRMVFHTRFVLAALAGRAVKWRSPPREDAETTWGEAFAQHWGHTLIGVVWAYGVYWLNPAFLWWLSPVLGALIVSVPLSVLSSRVSLGRRARAAGMFVIPEESVPPAEIRSTTINLLEPLQLAGFTEAVADARVNALVCATGCGRLRLAPQMRSESARLMDAAMTVGPAGLSAAQQMRLLDDPIALSRLHHKVWSIDDLHPVWRAARVASTARAPLAVS
jgi:membrane glycosyltransferase